MRLVALGGAFGALLFTTVVIACAALRPGYDHLTRFISELGATGTSRADLMNLIGFIPSGILIAGFGVAAAAILPRTVRSVLAGGLITAFGVAITVDGVFSCDPGCPMEGASLEATIHDRVAVAGFLAGIAGMGLWAHEFRRMPALSHLWKYSAASSVTAFASLLAIAASVDARVLTGLWQRVLVGSILLWCAVVGARVFRYEKARQPSH